MDVSDIASARLLRRLQRSRLKSQQREATRITQQRRLEKRILEKERMQGFYARYFSILIVGLRNNWSVPEMLRRQSYVSAQIRAFLTHG